jgi:hypothetical protein
MIRPRFDATGNRAGRAAALTCVKRNRREMPRSGIQACPWLLSSDYPAAGVGRDDRGMEL